MIPNPSELTVVAIQAALQAGEILRKGFGTYFEISSKEGIQNLVTEYDNISEKTICSCIFSRFPHHAFLAEESGESASYEKSDVLWIIDPLDGTVNFAHNIPIFSISIAAAVYKEIVSGVVYHPMAHELFVTEKNKGAYLNGKKLHVSQQSHLQQAILATGFPYNLPENPECLNQFFKIARIGMPIRRLGSAAIDMAYVAAGRFDGFWEISLHPWDMAAGKLLIEEAGGKVTHYNGAAHTLFCNDNLLASNGILHESLTHELKT